jgi:hypothetical protein
MPMDEHGCVRLGLDEAKGGHIGDRATVPSHLSLLEDVQRAVQLAEQIRESGVNETSGLDAVDRLCQSVMEEGVLYIQLMDCLVLIEGEGEESSNGGELDDGVEGLVIVHSKGVQ